MQTLLIADKGCVRELNRSKSHGLKKIVLGDGVEGHEAVNFRSDGSSLFLERTDYNEGEEENYMILCKEFGLISAGEDGRAKVSVMFCDEDYMLVTLYSGAIVVNVNGSPIMPMLGIDENNVPNVVLDNVYWVSASHLMSYSRYMGMKGSCIYDLEFMFSLAGEAFPSPTFKFKHLGEEDIDISGGYIAQLEQKQALKEQMRSVSNILNNTLGMTGTDDYEYSEVGTDTEEAEYDEEDEEDAW